MDDPPLLLIGYPAGGVFSGPGVSLEPSSENYEFYPGSLDDGTYQIMYNYTNPNTGCWNFVDATMIVVPPCNYIPPPADLLIVPTEITYLIQLVGPSNNWTHTFFVTAIPTYGQIYQYAGDGVLGAAINPGDTVINNGFVYYNFTDNVLFDSFTYLTLVDVNDTVTQVTLDCVDLYIPPPATTQPQTTNVLTTNFFTTAPFTTGVVTTAAITETTSSTSSIITSSGSSGDLPIQASSSAPANDSHVVLMALLIPLGIGLILLLVLGVYVTYKLRNRQRLGANAGEPIEMKHYPGQW